MIPIITLIGRSNVGKSTLFNKLTNTKTALTSNYGNLTRDKHYGKIKYKNSYIKIIDTASINKINEKKYLYILNNTLTAVTEANLILFITDIKNELFLVDKEIINFLRKFKKKIILVINKVDNKNLFFNAINFYNIGLKKIFYISTIHNLGINNLKKYIFLKFEIKNSKIFKNKMKYNTILIVGKQNAGKSTLINALAKRENLLVSNIPGTTRDSITVSIRFNNKKYLFIDTAGIKNFNKINSIQEKISIKHTIKNINYNNLILFIIDITKGFTRQDLSLLNILIKNNKNIIIICNKLDLISKIDFLKFKKLIMEKLKFVKYILIHYISAKFFNKINYIFYLIDKIFLNLNKKINLNNLNKILNQATKEYSPPSSLSYKKKIKLKYANIGGYNPLLIIIHGTRLENIRNSYKKYLSNYFRKHLNIIGVHIKIKFKINTFLKK